MPRYFDHILVCWEVFENFRTKICSCHSSAFLSNAAMCQSFSISSSVQCTYIKVYVCTKWQQSLNFGIWMLSVVFFSCCLGAFAVSQTKKLDQICTYIYSTISMLMCRHSIDKFTLSIVHTHDG